VHNRARPLQKKLPISRLQRNLVLASAFPILAQGGVIWEMTMSMQESRKSNRGFASMDPEKQKQIARKGGQNVPNEKRSFSQNPDLAARAGRKGGQSVDPQKRSFSRDHALASAAGRKGGHASHKPRTAAE
jgi:general stress protein YciG